MAELCQKTKDVKNSGGRRPRLDRQILQRLHSQGWTDGQIADHMASSGVKVDRTTVAKAREAMGLPPNRSVGKRGPGKVRRGATEGYLSYSGRPYPARPGPGQEYGSISRISQAEMAPAAIPDLPVNATIILRRKGETYVARIVLPGLGASAIALMSVARAMSLSGDIWAATILAAQAATLASRFVTTATAGSMGKGKQHPSLAAVGLMILVDCRARAGDANGAFWAIHCLKDLEARRRILLMALRTVARFEPQAASLGEAIKAAERSRISDLGLPPRPEPSRMVARVDVKVEKDGQVNLIRRDGVWEIGRMQDDAMVPDMPMPTPWLWPEVKHQSLLEWVLLGGLEDRATRRASKVNVHIGGK